MAIFKSRGKQLLSELDSHKKRLEQLRVEDAEIEASRYEVRKEKNRNARMDQVRIIGELEKELNQLKAGHPLPTRVDELRQEKSLLQKKAFGIRNEAYSLHIATGLEQFIVADPESAFGKEFKLAEQRLSQLMERKHNLQPNQDIGPRMRQEIHELQSIVAQWPKTQKACGFGRRLYEIDQQVEKLQKKEDELLAAWESEALQAALS